MASVDVEPNLVLPQYDTDIMEIIDSHAPGVSGIYNTSEKVMTNSFLLLDNAFEFLNLHSIEIINRDSNYVRLSHSEPCHR
jgi:hypothetical protein